MIDNVVVENWTTVVVGAEMVTVLKFVTVIADAWVVIVVRREIQAG